MASPPPEKISKIQRWGKASRRVFNQVRGAILPNSRPSSPNSSALPGTSSANKPNDVPGVVRDRSQYAMLSTHHSSSQRSSAFPVANSADKVAETPGVVGNRSQDAILPTSRPSFQQSSSYPEPNTSDKLKEAWSVTWSGLEIALRLLEKSADAFPPLKSAVGGLVACLDLAQVGHDYGFNTLYLV